MTGIEYDENKATELILYIAEKTEPDETAGSIKLNKILYFGELAHMRRFGSPITGAEYQKQPLGPTLRRMLPIVRRLVEEGAVREVERTYHGNTQKRLLALRRANLESFSAEEISAIDDIIRQLWGKTGMETSQLSHEDIGWRAVREGETIPLELAFVVQGPEVTDEMRERAQILAKEHS